MSSQSFADLGVSKPVVRVLADRGITEPFAVQELVIKDVLDGNDVLAQSPTGSGKTLAFGVPMIERIEATSPRPSALILAPTRELAEQIVEQLRAIAHAKSLSVAPVYGGVGIPKQAKLASRAHIVVACPGRLEDLIQRRDITLKHINLLVLDEADRMLDMGFKPAVDRIVAQTRQERQTLFFSATLEGEAGRVARDYTKDAKLHVHRATVDRLAKVSHRFVHLAHEEKLDALVSELQGEEERGRTLVFVRTKRGADRLVKRLDRSELKSVAMHGDKSQAQRRKALSRFESGHVDTLVATDVAARGIDVSGITHVINFDVPEDADTYTHRVGRTARAGESGVGISFVIPDQAHDMRKIARDAGAGDQYDATPGAPAERQGGGGQSRRRSGGGGRPGHRGQNGGTRGGGGRPGGRANGSGGQGKGGRSGQSGRRRPAGRS